ncbi:CpsD/CapB family tyrosine-protein kinase [Meridianimarinicoccus sp. MJW13]|uniref:CpsD/CapB family tyrosine-protein kinase n=1 Tax=Meridianimarinicoccus sp. MJW13 TaxID=2720031 RepID=UPI0018685608|nr:CpsD/CapB family tyrosine-protein kinase [Fluviibacterium sp. MJW13]
MERLQDALNRARERRNETIGTQQTPPKDKAAPVAETAPNQAQTRDTVKPAPVDDAVLSAWRALPQLAPNEELYRTNRLVSFFGGKQAAEIDMMRTKILQQAKANNWHRILVTSPTPRCGKTTVTANLAFSLARQTDLRILVIETDMRRPEMARVLGIKENMAFARVLSGQEPAEYHMVAYGSNLAFATNQVPAANSSELLQSSKAREALKKVEETYAPDIILFDAPPVLASDDTVGFLEYVDCSLMVVAAEVTSIEEIDVAETQIAAVTNVLGVVMNKVRYTAGGYGYDNAYY